MSSPISIPSLLEETKHQKSRLWGSEALLQQTKACRKLLKDCKTDQELSSEMVMRVDRMIKAWASLFLENDDIKEASRVGLLGSEEGHQAIVTSVLVKLNIKLERNLDRIADYFERLGCFPGRETFIWRCIYQVVPQSDVSHRVRFLKMTDDVSRKLTYVRSRQVIEDSQKLIDGFNETQPEEKRVKYKLLAEVVLDKLEKDDGEKSWEMLSQAIAHYQENFIEGCFECILEQPALVKSKFWAFMFHDEAKEKFLSPVLERYLLSPKKKMVNVLHFVSVFQLMTVESVERVGLQLASVATCQNQYVLLKQITYKLLTHSKSDSVKRIAKATFDADTCDHIVSQLLRDNHNPFEVILLIRDPKNRSLAIQKAYKCFFEKKDLQKMKDCLDLFCENDPQEEFLIVRCILDTASIVVERKPVEAAFAEVWGPIQKALDRNSIEFLTQMMEYFDEDYDLFCRMMATLSNFPLFRKELLGPFLHLLVNLQEECQIDIKKIEELLKRTQIMA